MILVHTEDRRTNTGAALQEALTGFPDHIGVVNWTGKNFFTDDVPVLNAHAITNKLKQLIDLSAAEVPTLEFTNEPLAGYLPRRIHHQQGFDFVRRNGRDRRRMARPDFYVKKEEFTDEYRVHIFLTKRDNMRVLRVAKRVPSRDDHHPWVRSHRLGWKLSYVGGAPELGVQAARSAMRALHLDFGAVDLGIRGDGTPLVLEVNTCPGLEGGTLMMYRDNIVERLS